ncbi:PASTA domain-containing protein [Thiolapillus sp.]
MSHSIVTITAVDEIVAVGADGVAKHVFTIRNDTGAPIKVGIQVLADDPVDNEWIAVDQPERELGENAADQVTVSVKPPTDMAAGRYTYRIRVYSIKQPGEAYTEGEKVAFEIKEKAKAVVQEAPHRKCGWCVPAAIVAAVLVLGGAGYIVYDKFFTPDDTIPMKGYTGWRLVDAIKDLNAKGLVFDAANLKTVWKDANSVSKVIDQKPLKDEKVKPGTPVTFTVGKSKTGFIFNAQEVKILKMKNPQILMQIKKFHTRAIEPESE